MFSYRGGNSKWVYLMCSDMAGTSLETENLHITIADTLRHTDRIVSDLLEAMKNLSLPLFLTVLQ